MTGPSPTAEGASARRDALLARVIQAALELFAERGYHGTSVPSVMERAAVGGGSLYRLFEGKEALVNAVFRDAKARLERALRDGLQPGLAPRALFDDFWERLAAFARAEPLRFRFLELQDHAPYLDGESRQLEVSVLAPILLACIDFQRRGV
ncbi:MAG TPA: TetR/AcrR family transcriptional regulator, partial [Polyangiaceae bacterium]